MDKWEPPSKVLFEMKADAEKPRPDGSKERPFEVVVPQFLEDKANALGTSCQQMADEQYNVHVHVKVIVVRPFD